MRHIQVSTDVFAKIWAHRIPGEESEDAILSRLLGTRSESRSLESAESAGLDKGTARMLWRDDVKCALVELGGSAPLAAIYQKVREIRRTQGRRLPRNTDAIIRRELEQNSPQSKSHTRLRNWFMPADGIGAGIWKLHDDA